MTNSNEHREQENNASFDVLYHNLATTWESHQSLRFGRAPLEDLSRSSVELDQARQAMWDWWRANRKVRRV